MRRIRRPLVAAALALALAVGAISGTATAAAPPANRPPAQRFSLRDSLNAAADHSLQLRQPALAVWRAHSALDRARAAAAAGGPPLAAALQQRFGAPLPPDAAGAGAVRRAAELSVHQAGLGLEQARQGLAMAVMRGYTEWQKASALVTAQEGALARARAQKANAQAAVAAGSAARYDEIQASAQVAAQEAALVAALSGRDAARRALARTLGVTLAGNLEPETPLPTAADAADLTGVEDLVATAWQDRPDAALGRLAVASRAVELSLLAGALPAGDPALALARLAVHEAALQLANTRADIRLQVEQALLAITSAQEKLRALAEAESQSQEALRLAELRFAAGAATSLEVTTSQAALGQAAASRIQAAADLALAIAALRQAMGEL